MNMLQNMYSLKDAPVATFRGTVYTMYIHLLHEGYAFSSQLIMSLTDYAFWRMPAP